MQHTKSGKQNYKISHRAITKKNKNGSFFKAQITAKYYHLKLSVATVKRFRTRNVASTSATC